MSRSLQTVLDTRLLNRDAAGVVAERLSESRLRELMNWFSHENGGACGELMLQRLPMLDTVVQSCVDSLLEQEESPRTVALTLFGAGVVLATGWLESTASDSPFPSDTDIGELFDALEGSDLNPAVGSTGEAQTVDLVANMNALCGLGPGVDLAVRTAYRMAGHLHSCRTQGPWPSQPLPMRPESRFVLMAGLLAAGVSIPAAGEEEVEWCCTEEQDAS